MLRFAIEMFNNFQRALNVYSCSTYSQIWTCANCSDSYKRWVCSQVRERCISVTMDAVSVSFSSCAEALSTQVYHKMYLPGTDRTEEGWVGGEDFSQKVAPRHPIYSLVVVLI